MKRKARIKNYLGRNLKKTRTPDCLTKKNRSSLMSKIRSKGTAFEKSFVVALKQSTKKRIRLNASEIKGKPDMVFLKERICVFLDSDFWHGWQYPRWKHLLKNDFWRDKIEANRKRDKKVTRYLRTRDWTVIRIWEHDLKRRFVISLDKVLSELNTRVIGLKLGGTPEAIQQKASRTGVSLKPTNQSLYSRGGR